MKELVVISGKGGTGKTSITASFAVLAHDAVLADCDVDAADLHLILEPEVMENEKFYSGKLAEIEEDKCVGCGLCAEYCRFEAVRKVDSGKYTIEANNCEGCGVCVRFCPNQVIRFDDRLCGDWMKSRTPAGSMAHARLGAAAENSGKLVATVRKNAKELAEKDGASLIIIDGPPGIGCPVIASITGASQVLIVTEPTVSGAHDMERVLKLAKHFDIPASICVNKWDLNSEMTDYIEEKAAEYGAELAGRVRYDNTVSMAQIEKKAIVEIDAPSAEDIRILWKKIEKKL